MFTPTATVSVPAPASGETVTQEACVDAVQSKVVVSGLDTTTVCEAGDGVPWTVEKESVSSESAMPTGGGSTMTVTSTGGTGRMSGAPISRRPTCGLPSTPSWSVATFTRTVASPLPDGSDTDNQATFGVMVQSKNGKPFESSVSVSGPGSGSPRVSVISSRSSVAVNTLSGVRGASSLPSSRPSSSESGSSG